MILLAFSFRVRKRWTRNRRPTCRFTRTTLSQATQMRILKFVGVAAVVAFAACSKSIYGGGGGGAPCDGQGADVVVNANASLRFSPESILITTGKKVCWQNTASFPHTVTSDTGTVLNSGNVAGGAFYVHTFAATGTVAYHCTIHQSSGMVGKVVIQ